MNLLDLIELRPLKEEDLAFVYATWLRQLWYSKTNTTTLSKASFFKIYRSQVDFLIRHHKGLVAALREDPDTILGYLIDTTPSPFTYVKKAWRDVGIELALRRNMEQ